MKEMVPLRVAAICGNIAFIAYGLSVGLAPIWVLHVALLPLNGWRSGFRATTCRRQAEAADPGSRPATTASSSALAWSAPKSIRKMNDRPNERIKPASREASEINQVISFAGFNAGLPLSPVRTLGLSG